VRVRGIFGSARSVYLDGSSSPSNMTDTLRPVAGPFVLGDALMSPLSWLRILALAAITICAPRAGQAGVLEDIKARGALMVGVKADYPPFGFRDPAGQIIGLEVDLARDIADRIGVPLKLMSVAASSRMQFLQQGAIDLIIATMSVTEGRAKQVGLIQPYYYASGVGVIARKGANIASAADLKGKPLCIIKGAYYGEKLLALAAGIDPLEVKTAAEGEKALREGQCIALADEDVRLLQKKHDQKEAWDDYAVTPVDLPPLPWAIAVRSEDKDGPLGTLVSAAVTDWHKSGKLLELERQWLGVNTKWLLDMHESLK
jgi:polar amino acid transport system substrate-binding protein